MGMAIVVSDSAIALAFAVEQPPGPASRRVRMGPSDTPRQLEYHPARRPRATPRSKECCRGYDEKRAQQPHPPGNRAVFGLVCRRRCDASRWPASAGAPNRLVKEERETLRVCVFASRALVAGPCNAVSQLRIREIALDLCCCLVGRAENLDFLPDAKIIGERFCRFRHEKAAASRHLEDPRLDLPTPIRNKPAPMHSRIAEIQADDRIARNAPHIRS